MSDKPPKLTIKQKKWLVRYFETGNATQAAMESYNCKNYSVAGSIGSENLQKLENPVRILMERNGLSIGSLIVKLSEGLDANKVISATIINKKGDGMKQANSMSKDFIDVPDFAIRHKYLETAGKWLGVEQEKEKISQQYNQFNFYNIPPEELKKRQQEVLKSISDG